MLIRFTVENFRSFHKEAILSMLPGRMKKHEHHIIETDNPHQVNVLRTGLLYGANASGKTNLIKAISFARKFIVTGVEAKKRIRVEPFRLAKKDVHAVTKFEFEIIVGSQAYAYGFEIDAKRVHEEWLYAIGQDEETPLFERTTDDDNNVAIVFSNPELLQTDNEQFRQFAAKATRPNQLFLTSSINNNLPDFDTVYEWFQHNLNIIYPTSRPHGIEVMIDNDDQFSNTLSKFLSQMNTGIERVCLHPVDIDSILLPAELISAIVDDFNPEEDVRIVLNTPNGRRYVFAFDDETAQLQAFSLGTIRKALDGREVTFDIFEESDGTQRLVDLFPVLHGAENQVFIIDELERSLHPNLVRKLIQWFLDNHSNSQLIVSTHESTLLDLNLLRRDEIWFVEKSPSNESILYSLEEFKPRADLDIRKGYLHGRFGAIPALGSSLMI